MNFENEMEKRMIDITAAVTLFPTVEGGRNGSTPPDKFGCMMIIDDVAIDCWLLLSSIGSLNPGQAAIVPISFLNPDFAKGFIKKGMHIKLRELNIIGEGEVLDVFM